MFDTESSLLNGRTTTPHARTYRPSVSQRLIWLDQLMSPRSPKYNIGGYASLEGSLDYAIFHQAVLDILRGQEIYHTVFGESGAELSCIVLPPPDSYVMELVDLSDREDAEAASLLWMENDFKQAFEVRHRPLFRFALLKLSTGKHFWYARIHHLISDGLSFKLLLNQTAEMYSAHCGGKSGIAPDYCYSEFAAEDEAYYLSSASLDDRAYWLEEFRQIPGELLSRKQVSSLQEQAGVDTLSLSGLSKTRLEQAAILFKGSVFQVVISLLLIYFNRSRLRNEIAVGMPVLNRTKKRYRNTAGVFMNLLAIPFRIGEGVSVGEVIKSVKEKMSASLRHQRYQYGNLVKDLKAGKPLYDVRVSYEDFSFTSDFGGLTTRAIALSNTGEIDKLAIYLRDYHDEGFDVRWVYDRAYLDASEIGSMKESLQKMIDHLPELASVSVGAIDLLAPAERSTIISMSSGPLQVRADASFLDMWRQSCKLYPDNICISTDEAHYRYACIDARARAVASSMLGLAAGSESIVALLLPRSEQMIIGILAAMMAGLTYIPIDTDTPAPRIRYMMEQAGCTVLLRAEDLLRMEESMETTIEMRPPGNGPRPCYIMFTSGSSGTPKGVCIGHASVVDYICSFRQYFQLTAGDVVMQQSSAGFDTSVEEIFPILSVGGRLHILPDRKDIAALLAAMEKERITLLSTSPLVIRILNTAALPSSLRVIISGGDVLKAEYISSLVRQPVQIYNTYGPTESTVCATFYEVDGSEPLIPIGKPIANREVYILDDHQQLQPLGVEGEICLGGAGIAMGYINSPELTSTKFIPHFLYEGKTLYRTGDAGVLMPDGNILFKGRKDEQLSFRGYRIEPAEVEKVMIERCEVTDCLICVKDHHAIPRLVAYVQSGKEIDMVSVRKVMAGWLPSYMVPEIIIAMEQFPVLSSGKVDRSGLPDIGPFVSAGGRDRDRVLPATDMERRIFAIWREVLGTGEFGTADAFFAIGGNSLLAMQLLNQYAVELGIKMTIRQLFDHETISEQAVVMAGLSAAAGILTADDTLIEAGARIAIPRAEPAIDYPVTGGQHRLWVLSQLEEASGAYNLSGSIDWDGSVDWLPDAVDRMVRRHEILRTVFIENAQGEIRQRVLAAADRSDFALSWEDAIATKEFDLAKGPLFRIGVIRTGPEKYVLHYSMHHIISDGWSMEILARELLSAAAESGDSRDEALSEGRLQYKDYAVWLSEQVNSPEMAEHRDHWISRLCAPLPVMELPADRPRPAVRRFHGAVMTGHIEAGLAEQLSDLGRSEGATLFMSLLTVVYSLLYRYTGQNDLIVGSPVAGRDHPMLEDQIGFFVNTLALRIEVDAIDSFRMLLQKVRQLCLSAYEHRAYPFDRVLQDLQVQWDRSRSPLFDVMVVLQTGQKLRGHHRMDNMGSKFDLVFDFLEDGSGRIHTRIEYNSDLFDHDTITRIYGHFLALIEAAVKQPGVAIGALCYLSAAEKDRLLSVFNDTEQPLPTAQTVLSLFEERVLLHPERAALVWEERVLSYRSLNETANRLGNYLRDRHAVGAGDIVAIRLGKSEWMMISILAVLKTGAAYLPIDTGYPDQRIDYMLADGGCKTIIDEALIDAFRPRSSFYGQENLALPCDGNALAYIIYTSGSTGKPKGVMVEHRALLNLCCWHVRSFSITEKDRATLYASFAFDAAVWEFFPYIIAGASLYGISESLRMDMGGLAAFYDANAISVSFLPTAIGEQFLEEENHSLRYLLLGGDRMTVWRPKPYTIVNNYGPTENAVVTTSLEVAGASASIPIGKPIDNVVVYVLDAHQALVPVGIYGEICIGGLSLAQGYLNREDLTAEKFVPNPFHPGQRMYRTGDRGRWLADGNIEFAGRKDDQVKIRGNRIETAEIELALTEYPPVAAAIVLARRDRYGEQELIAFIVPSSGMLLPDLRHWLGQRLPGYMVPSHFLLLKELPVTLNGKVDRHALSGMEPDGGGASEPVPAENPVQQKLVAIWEQVLGRRGIGIQDNFFDLGGNSLKAMKVITRIRLVFSIQLHIRNIFRSPDIENIALEIAFILEQEALKKTKASLRRIEI